MSCIQDSSRDIREALHELLCYTNVSTKECIQLALLELLKNLAKYPTDRNSVWKWVYKLYFCSAVQFALTSDSCMLLNTPHPPTPPDRCLKFLGARHPTLVLPIVPELLSTHPYFDTPEPDMDDPACILPSSTRFPLCCCVHALVKGVKYTEQWRSAVFWDMGLK